MRHHEVRELRATARSAMTTIPKRMATRGKRRCTRRSSVGGLAIALEDAPLAVVSAWERRREMAPLCSRGSSRVSCSIGCRYFRALLGLGVVYRLSSSPMSYSWAYLGCFLACVDPIAIPPFQVL